MREGLVTHAWVQTCLVVVIAALSLHVATGTGARWDLTSTQRYTLSTPAREASGRLSRPVNATIWITANLDAPFHEHQQTLLDTVNELASWSNGQLRVRLVDPTDDPALQAEAASLGVHPAQYRFRSRARTESRPVWLGVSLTSGTRQVAVSPVENLDTLEYELVRGLHALAADDDAQRTVGWIRAAGTPAIDQLPAEHPLGALRDKLRSQGELVEVALGGTEPVPPAVDTLVLVGPQRALSERAVWQLEQHLQRGRGVALFVSSVRADWSADRLDPLDHGLQRWLSTYGLTVGERAVADRQHPESLPLPVRTSAGVVTVNTAHPLLPWTTKLASDAPVVRGLDRVVAPFATAVATSPVSGLTTGHWFVAEDTAVLAPIGCPLSLPRWQTPLPTESSAAGLALAVGLEGVFPSAFADGRVPPVPATGMAQASDETITEGLPGRLAVVGSADVAANNPTLVLNIVDWLQQDDTLMAVRTRSAPTPRLDLSTAPDLRLLKGGMLALPLLLLWALGLLARRSTL